MLTLEQLNQLYPADAGLRRRLAALFEKTGRPASLVVWKEAVELDPDSEQGYLGLARAAIRFGDLQTGREALQRISTPGSEPAQYYRLQAGLAVLEGDLAAQEEWLGQLARLEPDDKRIRLNLALVRLADPDGPAAPAARAILAELAKQDEVRMRAVAELLLDISRQWPSPDPARDEALRRLAAELTPARGPSLLLPSQWDYVERLIKYAMEQPDPTAEDVISLADWMSLNGQFAAVLGWIDTLEPAIRESRPLRTARAEWAVRAQDWPRLHRLLLAGAWGRVPTETVTQAFRARDRDDPLVETSMRAGWSAALEAGKASPAGLRLLLRLATIWDWPAEYRVTLLTIARTMPRETWAWRQLITMAFAAGDSEQVWQVYQDWRRVTPGDPLVRVESAIMGQLLGHTRAPGSAKTAEYLRQQPKNPGATIAHALALWREGRLTAATALLDRLARTDFNEPRYALAAGIILAEAGRAVESEALLDRAAGERLLSEERALLQGARQRNRERRP